VTLVAAGLRHYPLTPRRPAAIWSLRSERAPERLIEGVGQMIPLSPMPPVNSMHWLHGGDTSKQLTALDNLERYTEALVREQLAPEREPTDLFAAGYQNAVQCRSWF